MYKFVPQKKRSQFRIRLGCVFYTLKRYLYWLKNNSKFASIPEKYKKSDNEQLKKDYPEIVFYHSSPLYRNLSKEDTKLQNAKVNNLLIAIKKINKTVIKPSQLFSYWKLIGNPLKIKGYKKGMMLVNGRPKAATGGGLCALSNLLYWIFLHSRLVVKERWRHSYDVFPDSNRTLPFGSGATCVYNFRDLIILNETEDDYALLVTIENNRLCGELRAKQNHNEVYEVYQKEHHITQEGSGIFVRHNTIYRKKYESENQKEPSEDIYITENHALMMYNPLISENKETKSDR
ncbi:MAG: VanW family protein [Treponema sp.]|nr:VanW family protein [Treponema sp.]